MKNIFVIGAGRSSASLIAYLLQNAVKNKWKITIGDISLDMVKQKTNGHPGARAIIFDINNPEQRQEEIEKADLVISMLPASLHLAAAQDCVRLKKHLVTASYVSKEIAALDAGAKKAGVILMNEIGLDPGIDHASAMKIVDQVKENGDELVAFRSYCGGLVAPESNDNPWGYKFSWNPRNVVLAGQSTAQYIEDGKYRYIPYNRLFTQTEKIRIKGFGEFEAYANRDSLSYRKPYGLENIPTMIRGTLRMPGYCKAWNVFVKLGITDDSYIINDAGKLTWPRLLEAFLPKGKKSVKQKLISFMGKEMDKGVMKKLEWLGIFDEKKIPVNATPAFILQKLLEEKWKLKERDKDMVVMQHIFEVKTGKKGNKGRIKKITSSLAVTGEDQVHTAMAKTVGLPAAITAKLILQEKIKARGVVIPTLKEIYEPVLSELETFGIKFDHSW